MMDCSPRGDVPGFVAVSDEQDQSFSLLLNLILNHPPCCDDSRSVNELCICIGKKMKVFCAFLVFQFGTSHCCYGNEQYIPVITINISKTPCWLNLVFVSADV